MTYTLTRVSADRMTRVADRLSRIVLADCNLMLGVFRRSAAVFAAMTKLRQWRSEGPVETAI